MGVDMMIFYRETGWRYWAASEVLLVIGLAGWYPAFALALVLALVQVAHYRARERSFTAFPVQVRIGYAAILLIALAPALHWLFWLPAVGTLALLLFGYCLLARCLSLMPWNRRERFTWQLAWRTFTAPPVRGSILQGLPAAEH